MNKHIFKKIDQYIHRKRVWTRVNSKKVLAGLTISFGLMVTFPLEKEVVHAETQAEIKAERSEVQSQLEEKKRELESIQAELIELNDDIERVDQAIEDNEKKMKETKDAIEEKKAEVEKLEAEVAKLEEDIAQRFEILKDRAASLQKNGGSIQYLDVLFGSTSFSDFIDRVAIVSKIAEADNSLIESYEADKEKVEEQKATIEAKLTELTDMQAELEVMQEEILLQKEENEAKKEKLETKEENAQSMVSELSLEDSELEQLQNNAQAQVDSNNQQSIETYSSEVSKSYGTATVSGNANSIISSGYKYIGNSSYKFGGGRSASDIVNGLFDCSGFVSWAFGQGGVSIPASTSGLSGVGQKISTSEMKPGDLVFFNTYKTNGHVGIYLGGNKFIGSQSSTGVAIADMGSGYWANHFSGHVRRVIN